MIAPLVTPTPRRLDSPNKFLDLPQDDDEAESATSPILSPSSPASHTSTNGSLSMSSSSAVPATFGNAVSSGGVRRQLVFPSNQSSSGSTNVTMSAVMIAASAANALNQPPQQTSQLVPSALPHPVAGLTQPILPHPFPTREDFSSTSGMMRTAMPISPGMAGLHPLGGTMVFYPQARYPVDRHVSSSTSQVWSRDVTNGMAMIAISPQPSRFGTAPIAPVSSIPTPMELVSDSMVPFRSATATATSVRPMGPPHPIVPMRDVLPMGPPQPIVPMRNIQSTHPGSSTRGLGKAAITMAKLQKKGKGKEKKATKNTAASERGADSKKTDDNDPDSEFIPSGDEGDTEDPKEPSGHDETDASAMGEDTLDAISKSSQRSKGKHELTFHKCLDCPQVTPMHLSLSLPSSLSSFPSFSFPSFPLNVCVYVARS
jgi:hypothetical protein